MAKSPGKPTSPKKPRAGVKPGHDGVRASGTTKAPKRAAPKRAARAAASPARERPLAGPRRRTPVAPDGSLQARSFAGFEEHPGEDPGAQSDHDGGAGYRLMELHWDDDPPQHTPTDDVVT